MTFRIRAFLALFVALAVLAVSVGLIAAWGTALWQEDGVQVCGATDDQDYPDIVPDGMGDRLPHGGSRVVHGRRGGRLFSDDSRPVGKARVQRRVSVGYGVFLSVFQGPSSLIFSNARN